MIMMNGAMGMMGEVLMMVWSARGDQEELVGTRMGKIDRQEVEIWVDVGRKYMEGIVDDRSDGSTIQWSFQWSSRCRPRWSKNQRDRTRG